MAFRLELGFIAFLLGLGIYRVLCCVLIVGLCTALFGIAMVDCFGF